MKAYPMGRELFHEDGRAERQTDIINLKDTISNSGERP